MKDLMYILTQSDVAAYLYFAYLPDRTASFSGLFGDWSAIEENLRKAKDSSLELLVEAGVKLLKRVFRETIAGTSKKHVLPLSGGLDSRAILGGLLDNVDASQIHAVTFGSPGAWDFEFGQQVARAAGVHCETFNLMAKGWKWNANELLETAKETESPVLVFTAAVNHGIARRFGTEFVYWSGFMGNPLDGDHLLKKDSTSWEEAVEHFNVKNRFAKSFKLTPPNFAPENCLPRTPFTDPSLVCYDDQIGFGIRQQCMVRPLILPRGYDYRTPFLHPEWVSFMLGAPRRYRENRRLYKEILRKAYPRLFSVPVKSNYGLPLGMPTYAIKAQRGFLKAKSVARRLIPRIPWGLEPQTNYIDFNQGLRERADLKELVYENLQNLQRRHVVNWLDLESLWNRHQRRQANYADALTLLTSLEIYIRAGESSVEPMKERLQ